MRYCSVCVWARSLSLKASLVIFEARALANPYGVSSVTFADIFQGYFELAPIPLPLGDIIEFTPVGLLLSKITFSVLWAGTA